MKTKLIATIAALVFLPLAGFSQTPPNPPNPPPPPAPPPSGPQQPGGPWERPDKMPKVPVTFLGIETSDVPRVVSEQLGLAKGFGLVVDYVVPDGPAAAAGVQQNDILKMLNDQILTEPAQLSKLIRSYNEGTTITLTVLRKGQEQKISVKLTKKEVPQRRDFGPGMRDHRMGDMDFGDLGGQLNDLRDQLGDSDHGMIHDAVMKAHDEVARVREETQQRVREETQRIREQAQRVRENAQRIREGAQRVRDEARHGNAITITKTDETGLKTTKIDLRKAQIVFSDDKGELRIDNASGKKILTAKDPQSRLLFSGPVETKEDLDKVPAEVRERFEKLEEKDLPSVVSEGADEEEDAADAEDMNDEDDAMPSVEQVSLQTFPFSAWAFRTVLI
jgi:serine protease Do